MRKLPRLSRKKLIEGRKGSPPSKKLKKRIRNRVDGLHPDKDSLKHEATIRRLTKQYSGGAGPEERESNLEEIGNSSILMDGKEQLMKKQPVLPNGLV